ncbi:MAG TPA: hypothetical protein VFS43_06350 [Polyangiaceae bacterium]|nr:hypothetical protein [Polyangiaceae bacterium]
MRPGRFALVAPLACCLGAGRARAQAPDEPRAPSGRASAEAEPRALTPAELRWDAPEECPPEAEVHAQVGRLLGRESLAGPRRVSVRGSASERGGRWRLSLRTETEGEVGRRSIDAPSCAELADAFTLIAALAIDPQATSERAGSVGPMPSRPGSGGRSALEVWAGLGARGSLGALPGLSFGAAALVALRSGPARYELGASYWPAHDEIVAAGPPEVGARIGLVSAGFSFCHDLAGAAVALEGCGGFDLGQMRSAPFGARDTGAERALWLALRAGPALRWRPGERLALRGLVEGVMPLVRPAFRVDGDFVHRPALAGAQALLAAELRF